MSFLDNLVNTALNAAGQTQGGGQLEQVLKVAGSLLQQHGGVDGLASKFQQAGLGQIVQSWISTGQNAPVSADQLAQVLGNSQISHIAQQLGVDTSQAGQLLSQYLPQVIDHLTPNGQVPAGHTLQGDLLNSALGMLKGRLLG